MVRKHRRNFLPVLIINLILWGIWLLVIFCLSPTQYFSLTISRFNFALPLNIILFFLTLTPPLTLTLAFLFGHTRRGFFLALFLDICLLLQLIREANWLNFSLILAFFLTSELYFSSHQSKSR
ncbi:MAG TPA: hypothetical protein VMW04_02750 [Patescibacteria group bacterium]|nr:hypothetical protein [Patescibacteria group bacterium]